MGEHTQEFLVGRAMDKRNREGRPLRSRFDRRSAYLFIWGNVYGIFGTLLLMATRNYGTDNLVLGTIFILSGLLSVTASVAESDRLDIASFTVLSGTAAAEAFWSVVDPSRDPLISVLGGVLWLGVAGAQVVVAGWPLGHRPPPGPEDRVRDRVRRLFVVRS